MQDGKVWSPIKLTDASVTSVLERNLTGIDGRNFSSANYRATTKSIFLVKDKPIHTNHSILLRWWVDATTLEFQILWLVQTTTTTSTTTIIITTTTTTNHFQIELCDFPHERKASQEKSILIWEVSNMLSPLVFTVHRCRCCGGWRWSRCPGAGAAMSHLMWMAVLLKSTAFRSAELPCQPFDWTCALLSWPSAPLPPPPPLPLLFLPSPPFLFLPHLIHLSSY